MPTERLCLAQALPPSGPRVFAEGLTLSPRADVTISERRIAVGQVRICITVCRRVGSVVVCATVCTRIIVVVIG